MAVTKDQITDSMKRDYLRDSSESMEFSGINKESGDFSLTLS